MGHSVPSPLESTYKPGETTDVPLGEFLARPVVIHSDEIPLNNQYDLQIDPWSLFLNDPLVKRRIEGFKHVRGRLKLRVIITGNPMLFGRFLVFYVPRATTNMHQFAQRFQEACYTQGTQYPHIFLDPSLGEGGEMELPFFCPENWLDLTEANSVRDMGQLRIETIKQLGHANGTTGTCSFSIFAWMEGAEICAPTAAPYGAWTYQSANASTHIEYVPEPSPKVSTTAITSVAMGIGSFILTALTFVATFHQRIRRLFRRQPDEVPQTGFGDSPVSKTATAIAKTAGVVSTIPALEPYAKATEMGATAIARIAHLFGFSRPQVLGDISKYREFTAGQLAPMNTKEVVARLSADEKGELTVDSRTVGLSGVDEMSIPYIVQREAIVSRVDWGEDAARHTNIVSVNVNPVHWSTDSSALTNFTILPPVSAVSQLFRYWRGTLIFRFKISASALHRGKLRVAYDPVTNSTSSAMNEVYSRIIDIETNRDFEVPVHWHSYQSWLKVEDADVGNPNTNIGITLVNNPVFSNGQITLSVLEPLTSPDPSLGNEIGIDISIRAGEDFEFADPTSKRISRWTFTNPDPNEIPQSALEADGMEDNLPEGGDPIEGIGAGELIHTDMSNLVFMGETIVSLRTLMKRYDGNDVQIFGGTVNYLAHRGRAKTSLTVHEYITAMFAGKRGSFRHKFLCPESNSSMLSATYTRETTPLEFKDLYEGSFYNTRNVEVEIPWYSPKRFSSARAHPNYLSATYRDLDDPDLHRLRLTTWEPTVKVHHFIAAGEDHSCFFFVGLPGLYVAP